MDRQQEFLASLVRKVTSSGVLLNPVRLYPLLDAATSSLTADPGLDTLSELYDFARGLQRTPSDQVRFLTVPREPYVHDHNRDELTQPEADELFTTLRQDGDVAIATKSGKSGKEGAKEQSGTPSTASASPSATYRGTTADQDGLSRCG
jgi:anionic cell wall polymer biosynthesis LytR-Cps2A-Psr (LCP) family protein